MGVVFPQLKVYICSLAIILFQDNFFSFGLYYSKEHFPEVITSLFQDFRWCGPSKIKQTNEREKQSKKKER